MVAGSSRAAFVHEARQRPAAMMQLAQAADGLDPAEALLDELPLLLTDRVPPVPR
jgi:hypothetical protein